jgi:drug/metabolite transporter (DMT)-like permease
VLLTSIGATSLILYIFKQWIEPMATYTCGSMTVTKIPFHDIIHLLSLLTFACINIIIGLGGMYKKSPNTSIYGFSSFILIGVYTIFLFLSGNLKNLSFPKISTKIKIAAVIAVALLFAGLNLAYFYGYGNIKKDKNKKINRERKRIRNTASAILSFSLLGELLLVALFAVYRNKDNIKISKSNE